MSQPVRLLGDFSGLVVLLPELDPLVAAWRSRFDAGAAEVSAHVSVLVPWIAPAELTGSDLDALAQLVGNWSRFEVSFSRFDSFEVAGGPSVHWLVPEPDEPFRQLTDDLSTGWPEYPPYGGAHGPEPVPHLTVASAPIGQDELVAMRAEITARLPITTLARELSVLEVLDGRCRTRASFALTR
ncbi:MAG: 2'-5' RNA ligase family protein [Jatrophihabitans sp.]